MNRLGEPEPYEHQITVEGTADASAIPDIATVTVGIDTEGADVATAQAENSTSMNALIEKVKALGIESRDVQTSYYNVYENTEWDGETYVSKGWIVSNQITVKVRNNELVSTMLDVAGQNGATNISGPSFEVEDTEDLKNEMRLAAIADAQTKAAAIAQGLGIELKRVIGFSEWNENDDDPYRVYAEMGFGGSDGAPTVEPGSEEFTLHVSLTYSLEE